ncbi:hypothetical protein BDZ45DRAFT_740351 [Acephala macrosclerotiorum]|nr:hypothetical protein BDZ45DRAFT_740351 [Acephala macrosclerotiorum]
MLRDVYRQYWMCACQCTTANVALLTSDVTPCVATSCPASEISAVLAAANAVCSCANSGPVGGTCPTSTGVLGSVSTSIGGGGTKTTSTGVVETSSTAIGSSGGGSGSESKSSVIVVGASSTAIGSSGSGSGSESKSSVIVGVGSGSGTSSTAAAEQSGAGGGGKGSSVTTSTKALSTEVATTSAPAQFTGAAGRFKAGVGILGAAMLVAVAL